MQLRSKRVVAALAVVAGVGAVGVAGLIGAVTADKERVASLQIHAVVSGDDTTRVTEVIDYDFGTANRDKHGIYRTIPDGLSMANITVSSPDAPDQFELLRVPAGTKIKIGDPKKTVSGRRRYEISYGLIGIARQGRLGLDAIGTGWEVPIRSATVDIATPWTNTEVRCDRGSTGDTGGCDAKQVEPGHLRLAVDDLDKGEGVTLSSSAGPPLGAAPTLGSFRAPPGDDSPALAAPAVLAMAAAAIGGLVSMVLVRRAGREWVTTGGAADAAFLESSDGEEPYSNLAPPPGAMATPPSRKIPVPTTIPIGAQRVDASALRGMATTEFAPPPRLSAAHGSVVLTESVTDDAKTAWLIEQTIAGSVAFDESTGTRQLLRNPDPKVPVPPVLAAAFASRSAIPLGAYDPGFATAWINLSKQLEDWRKGSMLWDPAGDRRRKTVGSLGFVGVLIGLAGTGFAAHFGLTPLVAVAALLGGLGIAAMANEWELAVRTPAGSATWLRVESFRRFLHESEVQHVDWAVEHGVLREYTAWAVAVGEIDRWNKALSRSTVAPQVDPSAYAYASMAHSFASAAHTASTSPSSSGGGGGVGGGGGGGGGGSW